MTTRFLQADSEKLGRHTSLLQNSALVGSGFWPENSTDRKCLEKGSNSSKLLSRNKRATGANPHMQLNPRELVMQFAHVLQQELFPLLQSAAGPLSEPLQLLASIISLVPLGRLLSARKAATGRPAKDRAALATAFMAKAVLNLATTRDLIDRLRVDQALRQFCGWRSPRALPHESKFSRAFAEFAATEPPHTLHEAV